MTRLSYLQRPRELSWIHFAKIPANGNAMAIDSCTALAKLQHPENEFSEL